MTGCIACHRRHAPTTVACGPWCLPPLKQPRPRLAVIAAHYQETPRSPYPRQETP